MSKPNPPSEPAMRAARQIYINLPIGSRVPLRGIGLDSVVVEMACIIEAAMPSPAAPPALREALKVAEIVLHHFAGLENWAGGETGNEWIWAKGNEPYVEAEIALKKVEEALAQLDSTAPPLPPVGICQYAKSHVHTQSDWCADWQEVGVPEPAPPSPAPQGERLVSLGTCKTDLHQWQPPHPDDEPALHPKRHSCIGWTPSPPAAPGKESE